MVGGVYKNWWLEVLESSFILNLGVLAAATYNMELRGCENRLGFSAKWSGRNQTAAYVSLTIAFVTTVGIFAYHIYLRIRNLQPWKACCKLISNKVKALFNYYREKLSTSTRETVDESNNESLQDNSKSVPSFSYIPLREILLENNYNN